jgi:voltage-gated potassium channel
MLEPTAWPHVGLSPLNQLVVVLIFASVGVAIVESEATVHSGRERVFFWVEIGFASLFFAEYVLRLWVSAESPAYGGGLLLGRLRYAISPAALLDLLAVLPVLFTLYGSEVFLLRLLRLVRILRLAKLGPFSVAIVAIVEAIKSRRYELTMSLLIAGLLLLISSTLLYLVEGGVQPDIFGSIPRAMWWSVTTLTTVGYGDAVPITAAGRILAGLTAIIGIGLIAMPTGILAAAFSDALAKQRRRRISKDGANDN